LKKIGECLVKGSPSRLEVDITPDNLKISEILKSEAPQNSTGLPGK
jgi:hypothetical protein